MHVSVPSTCECSAQLPVTGQTDTAADELIQMNKADRLFTRCPSELLTTVMGLIDLLPHPPRR